MKVHLAAGVRRTELTCLSLSLILALIAVECGCSWEKPGWAKRLSEVETRQGMQGEWRPVYAEENGKEVDKPTVMREQRRVIIDGNSLLMERFKDGAAGVYYGLFEISPETNAFDWMGTDPQGTAVKWIGRYELDDDELKLCFHYNPDGSAVRPKGLSTADAQGLNKAVLYVLKRHVSALASEKRSVEPAVVSVVSPLDRKEPVPSVSNSDGKTATGSGDSLPTRIAEAASGLAASQQSESRDGKVSLVPDLQKKAAEADMGGRSERAVGSSGGRPAGEPWAPEIFTVTELGYAGHPWVTRDGLTIYYSVKEGPQVPTLWTAKRINPGTAFKEKRQVALGLDCTFSENGLEGIIFLPEEGRGTLQVVRRKAISDDFDRPRLIAELGSKETGYGWLVSPVLSSSALTLYYEVIGVGACFSTRRTSTAQWSKPEKVPFNASKHGIQRFPYVTDDGLWFFCTNTEVQDTGSANIALYGRKEISDAFSFQGYLFAGDTPLNGEMPRYVSATRELFFVKKTNGIPEIHVVKNFDPFKDSEHVSPSRPFVERGVLKVKKDDKTTAN